MATSETVNRHVQNALRSTAVSTLPFDRWSAAQIHGIASGTVTFEDFIRATYELVTTTPERLQP